MKKQLLLAGMMLMASAPMFAQHAGQFGIGVNVGVSPQIDGSLKATHFTLGGRFQYSFTNVVRGTLDLNYGFPAGAVKNFDAVVDANAMIPLTTEKNFYLYPLAGVGFSHIMGHEWDPKNPSWNRFVFDVGLGGEYELSNNVAIGAEFKYRYKKDFSQLPVMLNLSYKF